MSRLVDLKTTPNVNGWLRYYTLFIMIVAVLWPTWVITLGVPFIRAWPPRGDNAALKPEVAYVVIYFEFLKQFVCFAGMYVRPLREEQGRVEAFKKLSFVLLICWCFQCALVLPGSPELYWAECISGLAIPIFGYWGPHILATKFSEEPFV